jgi:hypothetical protein
MRTWIEGIYWNLDRGINRTESEQRLEERLGIAKGLCSGREI